MAINIKDEDLVSDAIPAGAGLFGRYSSSDAAPTKRVGDERTHEGARRVFRGNYDVRGPYGVETTSTNSLTWGTD